MPSKQLIKRYSDATENSTPEQIERFYIRFLAEAFQEDGDPEIFYHLQAKVFENYNEQFRRRYMRDTTISREEYLTERVEQCAIIYYNLLNEFGLIDNTIRLTDRWLATHAGGTIQEEEALVAEVDPRRIEDCFARSKVLGREFFLAFHTTFVPQLTNKETYNDAIRESR